MGYTEQAKMAVDANFLNQLRIAMATAATQIQGEAVGNFTTAHFDKRQRLSEAVLNNPAGWLTQFAWAVAQDTAITMGAPVSISSSTNANPIVITTASAHGYSTGTVVAISGHATNTNANGCWTATVLSTTTFSIPAVGNGAGTASGQVVKMPLDSDIQFEVNSVWDDIAGVRSTD